MAFHNMFAHNLENNIIIDIMSNVMEMLMQNIPFTDTGAQIIEAGILSLCMICREETKINKYRCNTTHCTFELCDMCIFTLIDQE